MQKVAENWHFFFKYFVSDAIINRFIWAKINNLCVFSMPVKEKTACDYIIYNIKL